MVQVTSFVGVMRSPNGFQLEFLPKLGRAIEGGPPEARRLLIDMLKCFPGFRHIRTDSAHLLATRMPLLEVFIAEFLAAVEHVVKRGLRRDYVAEQSNLFALRGKMLVSQQLRQNLQRPDRFFTDHDEFSPDRPENRLLHAALKKVLGITVSELNQRLARKLVFVFADQSELDLFGSEEPEASVGPDRSALMHAMDTLNRRFGRGAVRIGSTTTAKANDAGTTSWSVRQDRRTPRYTTRWDEMPVVRG